MSSSTQPRSISPPVVTKKRRRAITDAERKAVRVYHAQANHPKPSGKALVNFFLESFNHRPSESTISDILSSQYSYLDGGHPLRLEQKKIRVANWVDLEDCLFEWQQRMESKRATVTGDLLKGMARQFWAKLSQYTGMPEPGFSNGWLKAFKKQHRIRKVIQHGESGGIDHVELELDLIDI